MKRDVLRLAMLPVLVGVAIASGPEQVASAAGPIVVNDTTDAPLSSGAGTGQCVSTHGGTCTLRAAIQTANQAGGSPVITLQTATTYTLTLAHTSSSDCTTEDGRDGDLHIASNLTINGAGATITGKSGWADRVLWIGNLNAANGGGGAYNVTLNDLTVSNGRAADTGSCNRVSGGGILNFSGGVVTLNHVSVSGNTATSGTQGSGNQGEGGGIWQNGSAGANQVMQLNNVTVTNNTSQNSEGGGIANDSHISVNGATFVGNSAPVKAGSASCGGGGMMNDAMATLVNVTFYNNSSFTGGGYTECNTSTLTNVTFSYNHASCTACGDNFAGYGTAHLADVILANPGSNGDCATVSGSSAPADGGNNLVTDSTCGFSGASDVTGKDPQLGALQLNAPGTTQTMAIGPGSPALDAGSNSTCAATDQRGVGRPQGPACDIGAYEYKAPPAATGATFHSLPPARILDTRSNSGVCSNSCATLGAASPITVQVTGRSDITSGVPSGVPTDGSVTSVVLNVTVTNPTQGSFLTLWKAGDSQPTASNLNYTAGQTVPNLVVVPVTSDGQVAVYNNSGYVDVIFDIAGYYATGSSAGALFHPLVPARLLDTRTATCVGPCVTMTPGGTLVLPVAGNGGVPNDGSVKAVVLNATVTGPGAASFLTVYPSDQARPIVSNLNFVAGQTVPNRVIVQVSGGSSPGSVTLYNNSGTVDVIIDVNGYFASGTGGGYNALTPARILDTRPDTCVTGPCTPLAPGGTLILPVAGHGGVPAIGASPPPTSVVLNVTVTNPSAGSFLTVYPTDASGRPLASDLNYVAGLTAPNLVVVKLSASDGSITIYNNSGSVDVIVDVEGWFS